MAHRNQRSFAPAFAGFAMAALLGPFCWSNQGAADVSRSQGSAEVLHLRTDGLPTPLVIVGDPLKRPVTSLEIRGEVAGDADGAGTITFDQSTLAFNEFGDATKAKPRTSEPIKVAFRRVKQGEPNEKRRLYELVFADGSFPKRMRLVLSDGTTGPHRMLIHGGEEPVAGREPRPAHVLDLQGLPEIKEPLPDGPLRTAFNLTTLSSSHGRAEGGLRRLAIRGTPNGPVSLDLDPNHLMFNAFGDVVGSTLIGNSPIKATLKRLEIPDPAKKGRLLFEVVTGGEALKAKYSLVLSPTERGPHRLLVREGDRLRHALPLHDPERRYHLALQRRLEETPAQERRAIADLRQRIGYGFRLKVESQSVVELAVHNGGDADRIDPLLKHLKNLRRLEFGGPQLSAAGLASLPELTKLEHLGFSSTHIDDRGLANLKDLPQLRGLSFYCCRGITDEGVAHLAGLKNLKSLQLYREDSLFKPDPKEKLVTDAGLENVKGLAELEYLNLMGQDITDTGLERLKGLTNLKKLYVSGDGITDAGLGHLKGLLHLERLHLFQTRVTPAGKAALRADLPVLNIGQ